MTNVAASSTASCLEISTLPATGPASSRRSGNLFQGCRITSPRHNSRILPSKNSPPPARSTGRMAARPRLPAGSFPVSCSEIPASPAVRAPSFVRTKSRPAGRRQHILPEPPPIIAGTGPPVPRQRRCQDIGDLVQNDLFRRVQGTRDLPRRSDQPLGFGAVPPRGQVADPHKPSVDLLLVRLSQVLPWQIQPSRIVSFVRCHRTGCLSATQGRQLRRVPCMGPSLYAVSSAAVTPSWRVSRDLGSRQPVADCDTILVLLAEYQPRR